MLLLETFLNRWGENNQTRKSVRAKVHEKKPVQEQTLKLKVYTLFLEQSKSLNCIYDWHDQVTEHCYARVQIQGKSILRIQMETGSKLSSENVLKSFKGFEHIPEIEYVEKVPTNNVWS